MTNFIPRSGSENNDVYFDIMYSHTINEVMQNDHQYATAKTVRWQRSFEGEDIPDYHRRRRRGELLPQTCWTQFEQKGTAGGIYDYRYRKSGQVHHVWWDGPYPPQTVNWHTPYDEVLALASTDNRFVQDAAARIYSNGFDALTFLAELTDIRRLYEDVGKKLLLLRRPPLKQIIDKRRKSRVWWSLKDLRAASGEWLNWRYGWRMIAYDILNIQDLLENWNVKRSRYSERCGMREKTHSTPTDVVVSAPYYNLRYVITRELEIARRGSVVADIDVPKLQFNPIQSAWELIPLSFVVDWFVGVGRMLSAVNFRLFVKNYSASAGCKVKLVEDKKQYIVSTKTDFISGTHDQWSSCTTECEVRKPCSVSISPHFALRLNRCKVLDLAGLVLQRFRR